MHDTMLTSTNANGIMNFFRTLMLMLMQNSLLVVVNTSERKIRFIRRKKEAK